LWAASMDVMLAPVPPAVCPCDGRLQLVRVATDADPGLLQGLWNDCCAHMEVCTALTACAPPLSFPVSCAPLSTASSLCLRCGPQSPLTHTHPALPTSSVPVERMRKAAPGLAACSGHTRTRTHVQAPADTRVRPRRALPVCPRRARRWADGPVALPTQHPGHRHLRGGAAPGPDALRVPAAARAPRRLAAAPRGLHVRAAKWRACACVLRGCACGLWRACACVLRGYACGLWCGSFRG
jgi:hypothetical protein